jgi:hypothetical protein
MVGVEDTPFERGKACGAEEEHFFGLQVPFVERSTCEGKRVAPSRREEW